ncbi:MAG TPA: hypothetical protein VFL57_16955 [Bryobacteraceae bacterium]|nr:hypothetical protein [Bryobacteraceae bacterium]
MLENAVFWLRLAGIVLTALGLIALAVSGYFASRLVAERRAESERLRTEMRSMEERYSRELGEGRQPKPTETRCLSAEEHRGLVAALQPLAGERVVVISAQDWEPATYAHQLITSLRAAGLDVRVTYYPENAEVPAGVEAIWRDQGERVLDALKKAGIELRASRGATRGDVPFELRVGPNPKR